MTSLDPHRSRNRAMMGLAAVVGVARLGLLVLLSSPVAGTVAAQQMIDPFAGSMAPGAPGPYGSAAGAYVHLLQNFQIMLSSAPQMLSGIFTGAMPSPIAETTPMGSAASGGTKASGAAGEGGEKAEAPEADVGESLWEIFVGACAGGAFLGGYSAVTAAAPAAATGVAAPAAATVVATAAAIGCGLGVATAAVSLGAVSGWRSIPR